MRPLWKTSLSDELRYLGRSSGRNALAPNPSTRPRSSHSGNMMRPRKRSINPRPSRPPAPPPPPVIGGGAFQRRAQPVDPLAPRGRRRILGLALQFDPVAIGERLQRV